ncbi:hypothetical protein [Microbacterium sp.]|uniref:hypothetical protein n=1 Tax=Microbacterium sp. TaxID=51671 RepID=UPI0027334C72|nr:hypothetical protein [Microbacterium sp.]
MLALIGLAMLGLPRVILHDLHIIDSAHPLSWILSLGPVAVWVAVAVARKVPHPFLTVLTIGVIFGVMLASTHQMLWGYLYADHPEFLSNDGIAGVVPRLAVIPGGLFAGAALGAVGGLITWGIQAALRRNPGLRLDRDADSNPIDGYPGRQQRLAASLSCRSCETSQANRA